MPDKNKIIRIVLIVIIIILLITPVVMVASSSYHVLILDNHSQFFKAKALCIIGNSLICFKDSGLYQSRKLALKNKETRFSLALLYVPDQHFIEIIPNPEDIDESGEIHGKYLGIYQINVIGHPGYLYLSSKDGRLYGTIRFPKWAKGTYEPLKNVHFSKGKINFTRSVTDINELRRVGANTYFVQQYSGEYSENGKFIKGFYIKEGARLLWEAVRIK